MAIPRLELDRPFSYLLKEEHEAGTGSLVTVSFHGRSIKGWVLGPANEIPPGRLLPVRKVNSPVRFFNGRMLRLFQWMSERYIAPLATVIERSHPPRVASEEAAFGAAAVDAPPPPPTFPPGVSRSVLARYGGERLLEPGTTTWLRPLPGDEQSVCVDAVDACLAQGKRAIVLVPEAEPLPATARAVLEAFGDRALAFLGGEPRERYRAWLQMFAGRFDVVVGTRPAVFSPLELGLVWVGREVHPGHREERSPYYHVREVAMARARLEQATCVLASMSPSVETVVATRSGKVRVARPPRQNERAAAPLVETATPEAEDRTSRLTGLLKRAHSAALIVSRRGYGVARLCRVCGEPAACALCRGPIVVERRKPACRVCGAAGVCANCGADSFAVERGGTERVAEWAQRTAPVPVHLEAPGEEPSAGPGPGFVLVGTAAAVKEVGPRRLELVAILDPDRALARAGVHAGEQALATWMEAAGWAGPRSGGGRVLLHTRHPAHPAIQALIRWEPVPFLMGQARTRTEAAFVPGHPVFRISGSGALEQDLRAAGATSVLATVSSRGTLCLVTVPPDDLARFRQEILRLASQGTVTRVEAEPQL